MKSMQAVIAIILGVIAAGASAQSFNHPSDFRAPGVQMAAVQGQAAWRKYKGPGGAFTIEMPAVPEYTTDPAEIPGGTPFTLHTYTATTNGGDLVFSASIKTYPADRDISNPEKIFKTILAADEQFFTGGEWNHGAWTKYQGFTAVESIGTVAGLVFRTRFVIRGQQMFSVKYVGPEGTGNSADANRFMDSLIIL
jgi:hypothetical protein